MGHLFALEEIIKPYIFAVDSTLIDAHGKVWHNSSMKKGMVLRPGIDTDARWGLSYQRIGWIFGYKLHMVSSTDSTSIVVVVPLTAEVTSANVSVIIRFILRWYPVYLQKQ